MLLCSHNLPVLAIVFQISIINFAYLEGNFRLKESVWKIIVMRPNRVRKKCLYYLIAVFPITWSYGFDKGIISMGPMVKGNETHSLMGNEHFGSNWISNLMGNVNFGSNWMVNYNFGPYFPQNFSEIMAKIAPGDFRT